MDLLAPKDASRIDRPCPAAADKVSHKVIAGLDAGGLRRFPLVDSLAPLISDERGMLPHAPRDVYALKATT